MLAHSLNFKSLVFLVLCKAFFSLPYNFEDNFDPASITISIDPRYHISSVSPLIVENNGLVTVNFSTTANPYTTDWIGAYSPAGMDNVNMSAPVQYGFSYQSSPSYTDTGFGNMVFNITNLRANISFYYFTGGTDDYKLVASFSNSVSFKNINEPIRNRVVATGNPNVFNLLWSSANVSTPTLKWGISETSLQYISQGTSTTIAKSSLCGAPANETGWRDPGQINLAQIVGVVEMKLSNTKIYYSFGDAFTNDFSPTFAFWVPPLAGQQPPNRGTQIVVMADLGVGQSNTSQYTAIWKETGPAAINTTMSVSHRIQQGEIDAVFHSGDISYANGYLSAWDYYLNMISPMAGGALYFTTVGNHESDWPDTASNPGYGSASGGECGVLATTLVPMPAPSVLNEPWWSYDIGIIHLVGMSTEHNFSVGSAQYEFIEQDLQAVNRSITPWIIFSGHRSMYIDSNDCCTNDDDDLCTQCVEGSDVGVMQQLQASVEPLLHHYKVNLAFAGHFHDVQRQSAVYQNKVVQNATMVTDEEGNSVALYDEPNATVWMVVGTAGNGFDLPSEIYPWSQAYFNDVHGYAIVRAENSTHLYWEWINSATNDINDRMVITQPAPEAQESTGGGSSSNGNNSSSDVLSKGAIFGIVFASVLVVLAAATIAYNRKALFGGTGGSSEGIPDTKDRLSTQLISASHMSDTGWHAADAETATTERV